MLPLIDYHRLGGDSLAEAIWHFFAAQKPR
jgi:hypothetical protein